MTKLPIIEDSSSGLALLDEAFDEIDIDLHWDAGPHATSGMPHAVHVMGHSVDHHNNRILLDTAEPR